MTIEEINNMPESTVEELKAKVAALEAHAASLKAQVKGTLTIKVSDKGAVQVNGLQRFPVTLYAPQWQKLLAIGDEILVFIEENKSALSFERPQTEKAEPYTEAQKTADWKIMHGQTTATEEQVQFATKRYNEYEQKRFGSK